MGLLFEGCFLTSSFGVSRGVRGNPSTAKRLLGDSPLKVGSTPSQIIGSRFVTHARFMTTWIPPPEEHVDFDATLTRNCCSRMSPGARFCSSGPGVRVFFVFLVPVGSWERLWEAMCGPVGGQRGPFWLQWAAKVVLSVPIGGQMWVKNGKQAIT